MGACQGFKRLAHIPLMGLNGTLKSRARTGACMAAMGAALSDADLAAVLTYIRSAWGNKAGRVTADDVKKIRAAIGGHPQPMTMEQLKALPE